MRYKAIDEIGHFEYHDAELQKIDFFEDDIIWQITRINATKDNTQNNIGIDMCIGNALVIFKHAHIVEITFDAYKVYDSKHVLIESVDERVANVCEYNEIFSDIMEGGCTVMDMEVLPKTEDGLSQVCFSLHSCSIQIAFSQSIIQWNEYNGKAWYEDDKWKK